MPPLEMEDGMKNDDTAAALTRMFRDVVLAVTEATEGMDIGDHRVWELARKLHGIWRAALRSVRAADTGDPAQALSGHQAMQELIRLIDAGGQG